MIYLYIYDIFMIYLPKGNSFLGKAFFKIQNAISQLIFLILNKDDVNCGNTNEIKI